MAIKKALCSINLNNVVQKSLDLAQAATTLLFRCKQPSNCPGATVTSPIQVQF